MAVGVTFSLRNATATNVVGHSYQLNTATNPDEESYGDSRYFNSHDTTGYAGAETDYQGVSADGSIIRTDTVIVDTEYNPQT